MSELPKLICGFTTTPIITPADFSNRNQQIEKILKLNGNAKNPEYSKQS